MTSADGKRLTQEEHMATRSVLTLVLIICVLMPVIFVPLDSASAQDTRERWVLGFHGGANMWFNDYNKRVVGEGGEFMVRYGISRAFSAGLLMGYEDMTANQVPTLLGVNTVKIQGIPGAVVGWIHLAPNRRFNPYLYFGLGALIYKRTINEVLDDTQGKFKTSINIPVGIGFEAFASKDVSIGLDLGYRIVDDWTDGRKNGKLDSYATAKVGVNFYLGTSASEREEIARVKAQRLKELSEAEARRAKELADAEALRLKLLADQRAQQIKDSTDAEARRLAEYNAHRPADTVIVLQRGKTVILKGINFEFGKATLTRDSETTLRLAYKLLLASPDVNVLIVGHTDNVGNATSNKKLSLRRAQTVKTWLIREGIAVKRLSVAGKGFDEPIDDTPTAEARASNRRIEFRVLK